MEKAGIESETLESQLRERQVELEASKREIEMLRTEKDFLEKRVSEVIVLNAYFGTINVTGFLAF